MEVSTRWMLRGDVPKVTSMLRASGEKDTEKSLERALFRSSVACMVAESDGEIVGFMSYDVGKVSKIKVSSLVVEESSRRRGVGRTLVSELVGKLNEKRNKVELLVSEYNLQAQLFLRSVGFKVEAVRSLSEDQSEYKFVYRLSESRQSV